MTLDTQMAIVVVGCIVGLELIRLTVRYAFKRFTRDDYVTRDDCKDCSEEKAKALSEVKTEIAALKKLLFKVALKVGVDEKEIEPLVE